MPTASITLLLCEDCCGEPPPPDCLDVATLDVTFSGTGFNCHDCDGAAIGTLVIGTSSLLDGLHTVTQSAPGVFDWTVGIPDGFTYQQYDGSDTTCTGAYTDEAGEIAIVVQCAGGLYSIQAVAGLLGGSYTLFEATGFLLNVATPDNGNGCGGTATLSL